MKVLTLYILTLSVLIGCKPKQEPQMDSMKVIENKDNNQTHNPEGNKSLIDTTRDAEYLVDTYTNGLYAIRAAEIVKQKTENVEIKAIADKVAGTNQTLINNLDKLASAKKMSLPSGLNMQQQHELTKLNNEEPENLERLFIEQMENEHREDIELLEKVSKQSEDNEISTVAISCLATLKTQYDEVVAARERFDF